MKKERTIYNEGLKRMAEAKAKALGVASASAAPVPVTKLVLTLDGERECLNAALRIFAEAYTIDPELKDFIVVKFGAACSMVQQPCDVCKGFMATRTLWKTWRYMEITDETCLYLELVRDLMAKVDADVRELFTKFIIFFATITAQAFTPSVVQQGWVASGLAPFNAEKMMARAPTYTSLTIDQRQLLLAAVDRLVPQVKEFGELTDAEIREAVGDASLFQPVFGARYRTREGLTPLHRLHVSRRRALVLSHQAILIAAGALEEPSTAPSGPKRVSSPLFSNCLTSTDDRGRSRADRQGAPREEERDCCSCCACAAANASAPRAPGPSGGGSVG